MQYAGNPLAWEWNPYACSLSPFGYGLRACLQIMSATKEGGKVCQILTLADNGESGVL